MGTPGRSIHLTKRARSRIIDVHLSALVCGLCLVLPFAAPLSTQADLINVISESRTVSATASASGSGMTMNDSHSDVGIVLDPFHGSVSAAAMEPDAETGINFANSSAHQDSTFGTDSFSVAQNISFMSGASLAQSPGGATDADATSLFQISFSVTQLSEMDIFLEREIFNGGQGYLEQFVLASLTHGSQDLSIGALSGSKSFSIMLFPGDTYTLTALQEAGSAVFDPLGEEGGGTSTLTAAIVPEGSTCWLLTIGLIFIFVRLRCSSAALPLL